MNKKIFSIIIILVFIITLFGNFTIVQAKELEQAIIDGQKILEGNKSSIINYEGMYIAANYLYNILMIIGIVFAIIRGIVLGVQIICGSIDEKADAKQLIIPYLWLVAGIAFAFAILKIILQIFSSLF